MADDFFATNALKKIHKKQNITNIFNPNTYYMYTDSNP